MTYLLVDHHKTSDVKNLSLLNNVQKSVARIKQ